MKRNFELPRWSHFLIAVISTLLVIALRYAATPVLKDTAPFFLTTVAVTVSAYIGGLWPGLLATLLTTMAGIILFLIPGEQYQLDEVRTRFVIAAQITISIVVSFICGALRSSEIAASESAEQERKAIGQLNSLFDSITDSVLAVGRDLSLLHYNRTAAETWNLSLAAQGRPLAECLPAETVEVLTTPIKEAIGGTSPTSLEFRNEQSGRWFDVRVFPSEEGVLVYFHDVSVRVAHEKEMASAISERERTSALLDSLLANAPIGFAFFDATYRCERVNGQFALVSNASAQNSLGKPLREILPATAGELEPLIDQVFQTGAALSEIEIESEGTDEKGNKRYMLAGLYPVKGRTGEVTSVGAITVEITQRRLVEDRLRASEERFRMMADHAPVMIWVCNDDGSPSWFNRPWLDFREKELPEALAEGRFPNVHPDDEKRVEEVYMDALHNKERFAIEYRVVDGHGGTHWLLAHGSPLMFAAGPHESYIVSSIEVTDRKEADENLRGVLANERAARSEAEHANRIKDEFVATLSHELRTPLTTMVGWTEILRSGKAKQKDVDDGLEAIEKSAKLQMQLINDLLDMSRMSTGKIRLHLEFAELYDLVASAVDMVRPTALAKSVDLTLAEEPDPIVVRVDPDRFAQVIWNLLTNAIKFTPHGGKVTVSVSKDGETSFVAISDTGEGIPPEFLPHVFDRFRQADGTISRQHGGLGLGLSIARQLAELHGGGIEARSPGMGQGSTFTISIPSADEHFFAHRSTDFLPADMEVAQSLREVCVLLVEDDTASRDLLKRILEGSGAIVIPASSAPEARKLLRETKPDVMISDVAMPGEDGYQLIRSIRSLPLNENGLIPAAALTAFAREGDREKAIAAGFQMHLTKPIESDELLKATLYLMRLRDSGAPAAEGKPAGQAPD